MSQQPLNLRKAIVIIKRFKAIVGLVAALGLLIGVGYTLLNPAGVSSTAIVSLPSSVRSAPTEVVIADSDPVLSVAASKLGAGVSPDKLRGEVNVTSPTNYLMSFTATASTTSDSEAIANAVAKSYVAYIASPGSPVDHIDAALFQPAVAGSPPSLLEAMLITGLVGALVGAVVGSVAVLAIGRRDRRLRDRDQIANSIGVPVIASVPVAHPTDPAGWASLLENYQPQAVHCWQLRTVLRYFGIGGQTAASSPGDGVAGAARGGDGVSLCVVSLAADPGALALGPQLAVYAASQGIPTALVIGPQQDAEAAAVLRAACAAPLMSLALPSQLKVVVHDDQDFDQVEGTVLNVVVTVVDSRAPRIPTTIRTNATLLGVSSGRATAEQLASAAVAAGVDGREVSGILVADPESTDKTTGRVPQLIRPSRRRLPSRMKDVVTESAR
jgi:capsular polysaccharide biosynthesis protein